MVSTNALSERELAVGRLVDGSYGASTSISGTRRDSGPSL